MQWLGLIAAVVVTSIFVAYVLRIAPRSNLKARTEARLELTRRATPPIGVTLEITADDRTVNRRLPTASFAVDAGQTLDERLDVGPFEALMEVAFTTGPVRQARIGAVVRGGGVIIRRGDTLLASGFGGADPTLVMTTLPIAMGRRMQELTFEFTGEAEGVRSLRCVWQPLDSQVPLPLPGAGATGRADQRLRGLRLAQRFNCVRCHAAPDETVGTRLEPDTPPVLGDAGGRLRPAWLRAWISDPSSQKTGTAMPELFPAGDAEDRIEDLAHFIVSMGGPMPSGGSPLDSDLVATGRMLYHQVGCVPCHGPLDQVPDAVAGARRAVSARVFEPLGAPSLKTDVPSLAAFLADPLAWRPSGRMPSMSLTPIEAESIASYLVAYDKETRGGPAAADAPFALDAARVERGRMTFSSVGCAACHTLGPDRTPIESTLAAPPLASLQNLDAGCLSPEPPPGVPAFTMRTDELLDLMAWLRGTADRRSDDVPADRLAVALDRFSCTACHVFHGERGPDDSIRPYFTTIEEADLGDEGRLPPDLSDVGGRLDQSWLRTVFSEAGRARPYLSSRMPQFGPGTDPLPGLLAQAAGVDPRVPPSEPECSAELASVGRQLVGDRAFNCIQCHTIAGRDATGTPGPDLARMSERLRFDGFSRWVHDPALVRPGTRMPSFFFAGRSGLTDLLDGDADRQVAALWCYLAQGEFLPLPEGLLDPGGLTLDVGDEPVVFRTYMADAGIRAITVGFPEQVHCAFDADACRLAAAWEGQFLNAAGAWAARGGSETNPLSVTWTPGDHPAVRLDAEDAVRAFRGYRLDEARRPVFLYDLVGPGSEPVRVSDQPYPPDASGHRLVRRIDLSGPPGSVVIVETGGLSLHRAAGTWEQSADGAWRVVLDREGAAALELEIAW